MRNQVGWSLGCLMLLLAALPTLAQPPAPPPPEKYRVALRYAIPADRDSHVMQYDAMIKHLVRLGFEFDPPLGKHPETDREDPNKNYLHGVIASAKALRLLEPISVKSIRIAPIDFDLPAGADEPVNVRLELAGNLNADRQRELSNQLRVLLQQMGFKEMVGYDHRGYNRRPYTRIVGSIPKVKLDLLNRDLRRQPAGWLAPIMPHEELPTPLRDVNPVQVIEVLRDKQPIKELIDPEPRIPEYLEKISADLWEQIKDLRIDVKMVPRGGDVIDFVVVTKPDPRPIRVQIAFIGDVKPDDRTWKIVLQDAAPGFFIEGQLGQFVTGIAQRDQVMRIAASPYVSVIRLPRVQQVNVDPAIKVAGDNAKALSESGLKGLHKDGIFSRGSRGQGIRIGIIDRDFRGWETLVKKKLLPTHTRLVDLTFDQDPQGNPLPYAGDPAQIGHGTLCAQSAALAAPDAEFVLIRAEIADPHELYDIVRYTQGGPVAPRIDRRYGELLSEGARLRVRRAELLRERAVILNDFTDDRDLKESLEFLGPFFSWLYSDREWHYQRMEEHEKLELAHRVLETRFRQNMKTIEELKGVSILVNAISWNSGYPAGAASPLSKALDDSTGPLWFQAVGNTRGQTWLGPYRSIPGDPAMKFVPDGAPLPKGRWSNETQFLAWQPYQGDTKPDLPAKAKLRLTMQWREPHDPDYFGKPGDPDDYRRPLATMRLQLLRQRDPATKLIPADMFDVVARTSGLPERTEHLLSGSFYEQVLEVPLAEAGRYAIRVEKMVSTQWILVPHEVRKTPMFRLIEGLTPSGIRPLGAPTLTALERNWDHRLKLFVEVIDEPNRVNGRAVFADFPTDIGAIGIPADARNVISVGAASFKNKPQPYSAYGTPAGMELARRPWLYAYDELELGGGGAFGTSVANAFAAGTVAAMLSGKMTREELLRELRAQEGQVLTVPPGKKK